PRRSLNSPVWGWTAPPPCRPTRSPERRGGADLGNLAAEEVARVEGRGPAAPGPGAPRPPDRSLINAAGAPPPPRGRPHLGRERERGACRRREPLRTKALRRSQCAT